MSVEFQDEVTENCPETECDNAVKETVTEAEVEATQETETEEDTQTAEKKPKKGLFGKKEQEPDPKDVAIAELTDQKQRLMAEFENFRKRTEKEKSAMFEIGAKSVIEKLLPVVDNFERGLASVSEEARADAGFANGMEMIYKQLMKMLEDVGVTPIEAVGQEFDPNLHNAVLHVENDEVGENIIVMEFQKGYKYRDTVVRHSMVQVAN